MANRPIRIMVIEDSRLYQMYLRRVMENDPQIEICAAAATAREARLLLDRVQPDVITLDLHLPDAAEFDLLRELTGAERPPVLVISSDPEACRAAIALGAADFVEKISESMRQEQFDMLVRLKIKNLAVPTHTPPLRLPRPGAAATVPLQALRQRVIAIGASLGGTETTLEILRALPAAMPGILVVQHMPEGFTHAYAMRLDRACALRVREARDFDRVEPGLVLVAPGRRQMRLVRAEGGYRVRCTQEEGTAGFCPSVDVLFSSVAQAAGERATGVILTGIGRDGAAGLLEMRRRGAVTIGQSRESCVVYGMPDAARRVGAVTEELSPERIARRLIAGARRPERTRREPGRGRV